jgi:phenylacetate-CoA ligase
MVQLLHRHGLEFFDKITGRNIVPRLNELKETQWLSSDELRALQMRRLQSVLEYAYAHVPHYQRVFDQVGFRPGDLERDPDSFRKIPPVSKVYMREHIDQFMTTDLVRRKGLSSEATSGSTGEPFAFWVDRYAQDYAVASSLRHHTWCGWQPGQPRAYLWGVLLVATFKSRVRGHVRNFLLNRFLVNAYSLSEKTMSRLADLIRRRKPKLLHGYTTSLYFFAKFVREKGWDDVKVPAVFTSAEMLYPHQRTCIEEALDCSVFNRYATQEVSGIACECDHHTGMHISTETNYVEILDQDNVPVSDGEAGNVVVTSLTKYSFPFIRYRFEDIGRMSTRQCSCGRKQPMLEAIEGRQNDMFRTREGRTVRGGFDRPFRTMEGVKKYQIIQKSLDHIIVRIVKDGPLSQAQRSKAEETLRISLGDHIKIDYEFPKEILPERSGKYRFRICEID